LKKGGKAALPTALDGTSPSEFLAHFTSPAGVHRRTAGFPTRPFRSAKCAPGTALKIAQLRGTSVERLGSGRSALSFIPFYSPLRNRYTFRPPTRQPQGENNKQQFPGGNSRLAFCHDRSKMMFVF
jgi:hypothetical protein